MLKSIAVIVLSALALGLLPAGVSAAVKEYPLFSRIDGYEFKSSSKELPFESKKFRTGEKSSESITVEGRYRGGSVCLDSFFFFLSGVSAFFRLPV